MAEENQDFEMFQGDKKVLAFSLSPSTLSNPTGMWGYARSSRAPLLAELTSANGRITFDNSSGTWIAYVYIYPADTAGLAAGTYFHQLRLQDDTLGPDVAAEGAMTVDPCILV